MSTVDNDVKNGTAQTIKDNEAKILTFKDKIAQHGQSLMRLESQDDDNSKKERADLESQRALAEKAVKSLEQKNIQIQKILDAKPKSMGLGEAVKESVEEKKEEE